MAILKVARLGHPVLRTPSEAVAKEVITSKKMQQFIDDMIETMHEYDGVGLAAPQVHVNQQIAVIEVKENQRYPKEAPVPLTVLINPRILRKSETFVDDWEGCLSIPDLRGLVPRVQTLELEAYNRKAEKIKISAAGFFARVIQHECDHLLGNVYVDRMRDLKTLSFLQEFMRYLY